MRRWIQFCCFIVSASCILHIPISGRCYLKKLEWRCEVTRCGERHAALFPPSYSVSSIGFAASTVPCSLRLQMGKNPPVFQTAAANSESLTSRLYTHVDPALLALRCSACSCSFYMPHGCSIINMQHPHSALTGSIDIQHRHVASTYSIDQQHQHAASTCSNDMQHRHSASTYCINMQHRHSALTCSIDIHHRHVASTYSIDQQHQHAASTNSINMQHRPTASTCSIDMQQWHAASAYSIDMQHRPTASTCSMNKAIDNYFL
jgi:hypothetical protein